MIDLTYEAKNDILEDFNVIRNELARYDPSLTQKDVIVLVNKIDIQETGTRHIDHVKKALGDLGLEALPISALTGEGLELLKWTLASRFFQHEKHEKRAS